MGLLGLKSFTTTREQEQHPKAGQTASRWAHPGIRNSFGCTRLPKSQSDLGRYHDCESQKSDAQTYGIITFVVFLSILPSTDFAEIGSFCNFPKTDGELRALGKIGLYERIGASANFR